MSYSSEIPVKSNRRMLWIGFLTLTSVFCIANSQQGQNFYFSGNDNRQQPRFIPFQQSQFPTAQQTFANYFPQTNAGPFLPFRSPNYHLEDSNAVGSSPKFQSQEPFNAASSFLPSQNTNTVVSDPRFDSLISSPGAFGSNNDDYAETSYSDTVSDVPSQRFNAVGQDRQPFRGSQIARFPAVAISEITRTQDNPNSPNILQTHSFNVHHTSHPPRHFEELPALQNNRWRSQTISEPENFNYRARNVPFSQYSSLRPPVADSVTDDVFHKFNNRFSTKEQTFIVNTQRPEVVEIPEAQPESDSTIPQYVAHDSYFILSNQHRESKPAKSNNVNSPRNSNNINYNKNSNNKGNSNILPTTYSPPILLDNRMRNTVVPTTESNNDIVTTLRYHNGARVSSGTRGRNKHNRPTNEADSKSTKMKTGTVTRATSSTNAEENVNFDVVTMSQDHLFVSEDNFKGFIDSSVIDSTETPTTEDLKDMLEGATVAAIPVSHAPVKKKVLPPIDPKTIFTSDEDNVRETTTEHSRKTATLKPSNLPTTSTEGWIIVASVQTSRSVSGARFIPSSAIKQEQHPLPLDVKSIKDAKTQLSNKTEDSLRSDSGITSKTPVLEMNATTTTKASSTLSTESIIDKLDQVQSELSSGILNVFPSQEKHTLDLPGVSLSVRSTDDVTESPTSKETFTRHYLSSTKPTTKVKAADRNKSLFDSVEFDDLSGLLPSGFKVRGFSPKSSSSSSPKTTSDAYSSSAATTVSSTITKSSTEKANRKDSKSKSTSLSSLKHKIKFDDVSFFLPPGYKSPPEESSVSESSAEKNESEIQKSTTITVTSTPTSDKVPDILSKAKPVDVSAFLPPGFKLETTTDSSSKLQSVLSKVQFKEVNDFVPLDYSPEPPKNITKMDGSSSKVVFPSRPGGNKKPLPSTSQTLKSNTTLSKSTSGAIASKPGLSLLPHQIPAIKKGWPTRATTEFAGWSTASPSPISVEKLLQAAKEAAAIESSSEAASSTSSSTTSTTPSTTTRKVTTPGICSHDCELAGSIKLVGGIKWVPELLDHNTKEWKTLADAVQHQLEIIFQISEVLSRWYQRIRIDGFSEGSVIVDYVVELSDLGRTVNTADMKRLFHETLVQEMVTSDSFISSNNSDYRQLRLGKYTIDPASTDFVVLPKSIMPAVRMTSQEAWVPQWAIAVIVIGLASLCFVIIFGITVIINKHKNSKKHPTALTEEMLNELNKSHMGAGFENYGADDLYNMEDVWNEKPFKNKRSSYYQEGSMPNIYDSWRSDWNGYYGNSYYNGSVRSGYSRRRSDYDTNF